MTVFTGLLETGSLIAVNLHTENLELAAIVIHTLYIVTYVSMLTFEFCKECPHSSSMKHKTFYYHMHTNMHIDCFGSCLLPPYIFEEHTHLRMFDLLRFL